MLWYCNILQTDYIKRKFSFVSTLNFRNPYVFPVFKISTRFIRTFYSGFFRFISFDHFMDHSYLRDTLSITNVYGDLVNFYTNVGNNNMTFISIQIYTTISMFCSMPFFYLFYSGWLDQVFSVILRTYKIFVSVRNFQFYFIHMWTTSMIYRVQW